MRGKYVITKSAFASLGNCAVTCDTKILVNTSVLKGFFDNIRIDERTVGYRTGERGRVERTYVRRGNGLYLKAAERTAINYLTVANRYTPR